jgi:selenide,water dikinase
MTTLNSAAAAIASACAGVNAMTDITGFGLMGHGREMAVGSGVTLVIEATSVPQIFGAMEAIRFGAIPGGLISNREFAECMVAEAEGSRIEEDLRKLMYDPQTSGGLLISVAQGDAAELFASLRSARIPAAKIGKVLAQQDGGPAIILK